MSWRWVPPVHSPLSWGALQRGFRAMTSRKAWQAALVELDDWMRATYAPASWIWTDSGTTALTLALKLAARETGSRRVALPAYGCYDLATACEGAGSEVLLYDLDPATLGPDWASLERAVAAGARTVVAVHLYGLPVDMPRLRELARASNLVLVEDAAQASGATLGGKPCGTHGELAVLSFGRGKGITAGGGGALLAHGRRWREEEHALEGRQGPGGAGGMALAKSVIQHLLARPAFYRIPASLPFLGLGETVYRTPHPAQAMSRSAAGILAEVLPLAERETGRRRANAGRLLQFAAGAGQIPASGCDADPAPGWLRLPLVTRIGPAGRTSARAVAECGVMPGYPAVLVDLPGFSARVLNRSDEFPGACLLVERLLTLPTHSQLSDRDMTRLERWLGDGAKS